jgi:hypothetical protein
MDREKKEPEKWGLYRTGFSIAKKGDPYEKDICNDCIRSTRKLQKSINENEKKKKREAKREAYEKNGKNPAFRCRG